MSTMAWQWHLTPLVRSSIPSSKVPGKMWLSSECTYHSRLRYFSQCTQEGFIMSTWRRWNKIISIRAWTTKFGTYWLTKWMSNTPLATLTCSLWPKSWEDGPKPEILCSWKPPQLEDQMLLGHRHQGTCFSLGSWRAIIPSLLNLP